MTRLHFTLVKVWIVVAVMCAGCPKRVPNYDAASRVCETGFGFIAQVRDEEHCNELQNVEDESERVWIDAGLLPADGGGNARYFKGVVIAIGKNSDGGTYPNPNYDGGPGQSRDLHGDSKYACPQIIGRKVMYLANFDWTRGPFCHEGTHILRACVGMDHLWIDVKTVLPDGGTKTERLWSGWFIDNKIDAKCGAAMRSLEQQQ